MTVYTRGASHTVVDACVPIINSLGEWNKMFPLETISNDNLGLLRNFGIFSDSHSDPERFV